MRVENVDRQLDRADRQTSVYRKSKGGNAEVTERRRSEAAGNKRRSECV